MLHTFFEAGLQSGIIFSLDMKFVGKSDLFDVNIDDKLENGKSILKDLIKPKTYC